MNAVPELILYFDGHCPFCDAEMSRLRNAGMAHASRSIHSFADVKRIH